MSEDTERRFVIRLPELDQVQEVRWVPHAPLRLGLNGPVVGHVTTVEKEDGRLVAHMVVDDLQAAELMAGDAALHLTVDWPTKERHADGY